MRRSLAVVAVGLVLAATAGAAQADVVDVVAVPSVAGLLTVTGAGLGSVTAPAQAANTAIGGSASLPGSQLLVTDATGSTAGWDVTATYSQLSAGQLGALTAALPTVPGSPVAVADLGASNIRVSGATTAALATTNATAGVASPVFLTNAALTSPVQVARSGGDGRGLTLFNTSYTISLPIKSASAATLYTGQVTYTVAPHV
jgi:hypothetical protein